MTSFFDYILAHPVILIVTGTIVFALILFYLLKGFFKIILVSILIILAGLIGYHYYEAGGNFNERMKSALLETKEQIASYVGKGKDAILRGKKMIEPEERTGGKESQKRQKSKLEDV